ncbi:MAG: hypothetical protein HC933_11685 [Pleurocapsa sp. SU_196_0]|nr:hypothetical protein [Pleurocapsa sp. SU_196_0]
MIEEATAENIEALDIDEAELEGERDANSTMDEANLSYMEDPDPRDGVDALRAANGSTEENTNPAMIDEVLPHRNVEDENADPVGDASR